MCAEIRRLILSLKIIKMRLLIYWLLMRWKVLITFEDDQKYLKYLKAQHKLLSADQWAHMVEERDIEGLGTTASSARSFTTLL
ncbi:hypothetical protein CS542_05250 [Pedobacter sp. IW39]|nr:hypothetical protein CS542_05250 [Pedobacter sp. IW39]